MQMPSNPTPPDNMDIHYLVEDVLSALPKYIRQGYSIAVEPFSTEEGKCVVLQDPQGTRLGILERPIETDPSIRH
jgi:predicted enzyme related to lactoylglutathione lyase